jgi:hypothetical protein
VTPGAGCVAVDAHTADCAGVQNAVVDTGDMDDRARGGPGADEVRGGDGDDVLFDGDTTDFEHDVLDGGDGHDWADYSERRSSVIFDLDARTGLDDESDDLIGIESLHGGQRNDVLHGTDGPNRLWGWEGRDRLYGRFGDDELQGGQGADRMWCAGGHDTVHVSTRGDFIAHNCEEAIFDETRIDYAVWPYPVKFARRAVTFNFGCPTFRADGKTPKCRGTVVLRVPGKRKVLGRGKLARGGRDVRPVRVKLTRAGRRKAATRKGARATVNIKLRAGDRRASVAYTYRLRSYFYGP